MTDRIPVSAPAPLVFITGASSGIGQALAWRYHQAGYRLALVARNVSSIESWAKALNISGTSYQIYSVDVCDRAALGTAAQACIERQGLPDVVIANAGISIGVDTAEAADLAVMERILATNVLGVAATFQPFIRPMQARGRGVFVGVGSVAGVRGLPGHGGYCASKAALAAYCESLRGELRPQGLRVVLLVPGYVDTPLTRQNRYAMPFLMRPEAFADKAFDAIAAGVSERVIPWQMGWVAKALRVLPNAWFDRLLAGRPRKHRADERRP